MEILRDLRLRLRGISIVPRFPSGVEYRHSSVSLM